MHAEVGWKLLASATGSGARCGVWRTEHTRLSIETPALVIPTNKGFVPHVTSQLLHEHLPSPLLLQVALEDLVDTPFESFAEQRARDGLPSGLSAFCNFGANAAVLLTSENSMAPFADAKISKKRVVLRARTGQRAMEPAAFAALAGAARADLVCFPTAQLPHAAGTKAYDKAVNGTLQFMDAAAAAAPGPLAATMAGAVVVGGANDKMRQWSCEQTARRDAARHFVFCGVARIGDAAERERVVRHALELLPASRMRVTQGSFAPAQLADAVALGVDLVCNSYPLECAAQGIACVFSLPDDNAAAAAAAAAEQQQSQQNNSSHSFIVDNELIDLRDARHVTDTTPLQRNCACPACRGGASRAYVHHLLATHEMLAHTLLALHNLHRFASLMRHIRHAIRADAARPARQPHNE